MNPEFERCLRNKKIKMFSRGKMLAGKESKVAASDLEQAKITFQNDNYKLGHYTMLLFDVSFGEGITLC